MQLEGRDSWNKTQQRTCRVCLSDPGRSASRGSFNTPLKEILSKAPTWDYQNLLSVCLILWSAFWLKLFTFSFVCFSDARE